MFEVSDVVKHLISDRGRVPDHSILVCDLIISEYIRGTTLPADTKQTCDKSRCELLLNIFRYRFHYNINDNNVFMCNEYFDDILQNLHHQLWSLCGLDSSVHQSDHVLHDMNEDYFLSKNVIF